jgi:hypothetical protein
MPPTSTPKRRISSRRGVEEPSCSEVEPAAPRLVKGELLTVDVGWMIQLYSTMVGAVILSSAVDDDSLSRQILETVAKALKNRGER